METRAWLGKGLVMPGPRRPDSNCEPSASPDPMQGAENSLVAWYTRQGMMPSAAGEQSKDEPPPPDGTSPVDDSAA